MGGKDDNTCCCRLLDKATVDAVDPNAPDHG